MKAHLAGCFILTVLVLFACVHFAIAGAKLKLQVQPKLSVAPIREWHLRAWVDRDPNNRLLRIDALESGIEFSATEKQLDGEQAPRVFEVWWKGFVPCGDYTIAARTFDGAGAELARAVEHATICVAPDPE